MESHIGADLLHELMPSTFKADLEEPVPSPSPPCLLTAIGAGGLAADVFKQPKRDIRIRIMLI